MPNQAIFKVHKARGKQKDYFKVGMEAVLIDKYRNTEFATMEDFQRLFLNEINSYHSEEVIQVFLKKYAYVSCKFHQCPF